MNDRPVFRVRRAGMTLVELLVVMAILATLVALLFPAVNAAREASRRTACTANQVRLALAMISYDSQKQALPGLRNNLLLAPGVVTASGTNVRRASWAVMLLPYVERKDIYERMLENRMWSDSTNATSEAALVSAFLCPSFKPKKQQYAYSSLHYGVNVGTGINKNDGVLVDNTGQLRQSIRDVENGDGTSLTFLHSEGAFDSWPGGWGPAWHVEATNASVFGNSRSLPFGMSGSPVARVINGPVGQLSLPRSKHPGGAVMAFCDGHAGFFKDSLSPSVYGHLTTSRSAWSGTSYAPTNSTNANSWLRGAGAPPVAQEPYQLKESDL